MIKLLIQAFWTSLITSSSSFLSFLGIAVLARYISPETFGVYIFCLAAKEIISSTCAPSLSQAYLFSDGTPEDLGSVCKINILYSFFIAIVSIIAAFIIKVKYGDFYFNIIILFGVLSIFNNYSAIFLSIGEKKMNFKKVSFIRSFSLTVSLLITCVLAIIFGDNLTILIVKEVIFSILLFSLSLTFYSKFTKKQKINSNIKYLFKYSLRSYFPRLSETLSYKIFDLMTASLLGKNFLGLFNQALNIIRIPYKFLGAVTDNILFVHLKNHKQKKKIDDFNSIQDLILLITIPAILFFNLFNYEIIRIVLGEKWIETANILGLLSIFIIILPFYNSLITVYQALDNQKYYTYTNCLILFVQILAIYILPKSIDIFIMIYCASFLLGTMYLTYNIDKNNGFYRKEILDTLLKILIIISQIILYYYLKLIIFLLVLFFIWIYMLFKNKIIFLLLKKKWKN